MMRSHFPKRGSTRVLHILAPAREGGLERVVAMLSELQGRERAHVAAVLSPRDAGGHPFIAALTAANTPVTQVVVGPRSYLREYRSLGAIVTRVKPDVVHTHGYRGDVIGGAVGRAHGLPVVSTVHGFTGGGRRNRLNESIQRFALRHADAVVAVSRPLVTELQRAGVPPDRIRFVPNGFIPPAEPLSRDHARQLLGIARDALTVGWVGRLSREKGPDVMLDALAKTDSRWRLSMIGDGQEAVGLSEMAESLGIVDRILWHGAVANAGAAFRAFDAFVLSSRSEGTPIVLFEAMHAKIPIVAASVGGVPDVLTTEDALLVSPEKPADIAASLAEIARDPMAAARRSDQAWNRLRDGFSAEAWVHAVDNVYRMVMGPGQSRSPAHSM